MTSTFELIGGTVQDLVVVAPTNGFATLGPFTSLTLDECSSTEVELGAFAQGEALLRMDRCNLSATVTAVRSVEVDGSYPVVEASRSTAASPSPSWDLNGHDERLSDCRGQGFNLAGTRTIASDVDVHGICDPYGLRIAGSRILVTGGRVACATEVGLWSDDARCSRVTGLTVYAGGDNGDTNCSDVAVRASGTNTEPEVMFDGVDICGQGAYPVLTYGCNAEGLYDCAGDPCSSCPDPECDDPEHPSDSPCTDEDCWPPEEERLPQLYSYCFAPADLWDVQVPIKSTRSLEFGWRELVAGEMSNLWRPGTVDCAIEAVLHVWVDGTPTGDTEVTIYDDGTGLSWPLVCPEGDEIAVASLNLDLLPEGPYANLSQLRAELVSVTSADAVQANLVVRLP